MRMRMKMKMAGGLRRSLQLFHHLALLAVLVICLLRAIHAAPSCDSDTDCHDYYSGIVNHTLSNSAITCLSNGFCSNPFQYGCIQAITGKNSIQRMNLARLCNSDDPVFQFTESSDDNQIYCNRSNFTYPEIRIHPANWHSSLFQAWIYQILLMEIALVPTTVGLTTSQTKIASFYSMENSLENAFSTVGYPYDALEASNFVENFNCANTLEPDDHCVHVLPDVWSHQRDLAQYYTRDNDTKPPIIESPTANGQIGQFRFYIPAFTAKQFPSLATHYGYQGERQRSFLASLFQRPTTWLDYCQEVSSTNCSVPDDTAQRFPTIPDEQGLYFKQDVYTGYFRLTNQNNCNQNPTTCTGHVVVPPCDWSANPEVQLYWNNIVGLQIDGPLPPHGGYNSGSMTEIWKAANATRSHVFMLWYQPDALNEQFHGTPAEFQQVVFPPPTAECTRNHRLPTHKKCSDNIWDRRGDFFGACDYEPFTLQRLIAMSMVESTLDATDAERSPAYDVLKKFKMTELEMNTIMNQWLEHGDARQAVCQWVVENLDTLEEFVPQDYPKKLKARSNYKGFELLVVRSFATFTAMVTIATVVLCIKYQDTKILVYAQPFFILFILFGFLSISLGALLLTFKPSREICTSAFWLIELGYTIELVPVVVKTAAINQLVNSYSKKKSQRVYMNRRLIFVKVAAMVSLVLVFLITWTLSDQPHAVETTEISPDDEKIVNYDLKCGSRNPHWRVIAFGWELMLLLVAAVLAFQSRSILKEFNDSRSLGIMVYSHSLFMLLRGVLYFFYLDSSYASSAIAAGFTVNYALDTLVAMSIYILPKIYEASKGQNTLGESRMNRRASTRDSAPDASGVSDTPQSDGFLKVLVCSANLGNEQPTLESMEEWIPTGGLRVVVDPLGEGSPLLRGRFDLIAIGMQESTWESKTASTRHFSIKDSVRSVSTKETGSTKETARVSTRKSSISEEAEGILTAMEDQNTIALREMVQDILGDDYYQVAEERRGQMRLHLWGSGSVIDDIEDVKISGASTGIGNVIANKGGIVVTLTYKKTRISFLSAHLAAHEGTSYYKARCKSIRTILREGKTFDLSKKLDVAVSSHHMFVLGDLNFRTDFGQESNHEDRIDRAMDLIERKDYATLYKYDELQRGIRKGDLLLNFKTLPCHFAPTFKVERRLGSFYTRQRIPSYTDRILFKSADTLEGNLVPESYENCEGFTTSDHKPIRGAFSIIPNGIEESQPQLGEVRLTFRKMECKHLPAADANGLSDPYLMFMWSDVELQSDVQAFEDKMRKVFLGRSWPRTKYIPKTLDPKWKGQEITLTSKILNVGPEAMLFLVAMDYDSLTIVNDDFLGALPLNIKDLFAQGLPNKELSFDRKLERDGKYTGRIKFKLQVERVVQRKRLTFRQRSSRNTLP